MDRRTKPSPFVSLVRRCLKSSSDFFTKTGNSVHDRGIFLGKVYRLHGLKQQ